LVIASLIFNVLLKRKTLPNVYQKSIISSLESSITLFYIGIFHDFGIIYRSIPLMF